MTSGLGVEHVEQQLTFHCSCGAAIETSEKKETCWNCGETVELRRCIPTANGNKYVLRISKPRPSIETQQFVWPRSFSAGTTMQGATHRREVPDHSQRYIRLGFLILLSPLWVPMLVVLFVGIFGPPPAPVAQQDQPHHYERHDIIVIDSKGGRHTFRSWKRVGNRIELQRSVNLSWETPNPAKEEPGRPAIAPAPDGSDPSIDATWQLPTSIPLVLRRVER